MPAEFRVCPQCGIAPTEIAESEWKELEAERAFLLARGLEFTDFRAPRFMGIPGWWLERLGQVTPFVDASELGSHELGWEPDELIECVKTSDGAKRAEAAVRLGVLGHESPDSLIAVAMGLKEPVGTFRRSIYWAVAELGNPALLRPLMLLTRREHDSECWSWLRLALMRVCDRQLDRSSRPQGSSGTEGDWAASVGLAPANRHISAEALLARAVRARLRGRMLAALGYSTQAWEKSQGTLGEALLERSQVFLLMGKPIFALDDFLLAPRHPDRREDAFERHRFGLLEVCRTLEATCESQGLHGMASLFALRLRILETA